MRKSKPAGTAAHRMKVKPGESRARWLGIDPGIANLGLVLIEIEATNQPPRVTWARSLDLRRADVRIKDETLAACAYRILTEILIDEPSIMAVGVETFTHRAWHGRPVTSAPEMGQVCAAFELACQTFGVAHLGVEPADHKALALPQRIYSFKLRNAHQRDAYTVAWYTQIAHPRTHVT